MLGWFVGQVMKATGGKANPQAVSDVLESALGALKSRAANRSRRLIRANRVAARSRIGRARDKNLTLVTKKNSIAIRLSRASF